MDESTNGQKPIPGLPKPTPEYPTEAQLKAYGDLMFLYMRVRKYEPVPMGRVRRVIQPPIDLGLYKVFYQDKVPRAAVTWAFLGPEQEKQFARGEGLRPSDWLSGPQLWIMDIYAPYGLGTGRDVLRWLMSTVSKQHNLVRSPRVKEGTLHRIVQSRRRDDGGWTNQSLSMEDFLSTLVDEDAPSVT